MVNGSINPSLNMMLMYLVSTRLWDTISSFRWHRTEEQVTSEQLAIKTFGAFAISVPCRRSHFEFTLHCKYIQTPNHSAVIESSAMVSGCTDRTISVMRNAHETKHKDMATPVVSHVDRLRRDYAICSCHTAHTHTLTERDVMSLKRVRRPIGLHRRSITM